MACETFRAVPVSRFLRNMETNQLNLMHRGLGPQVTNNRIPPEGAIRLALGLKANKTIKFLHIGRNPIQSAGCYGILQSVRENPNSAMETLDFSNIPVNQEFEELYSAVKEIFPGLRVKHGGLSGTFGRAKAGKE
ncbi:unnamed protein product [Menidia menidia]|uniref:(Atlantic silverside) hypothetical protein n=1 Tax=Menidia menidia TaxID=238744 RepID=A0A8S4AZC6_9TELE|nr:unnamed protein product [Menidia menidia]